MNIKNLVLTILWGSLSTAISLAVAEYAVRWWFAEPGQGYEALLNTPTYKFYEYDPVLGWKNKPHAQGVFKREEFEYSVSVNSNGLRQSEVSLVPDHKKPRIAFMGDSFLWGLGATDAQRYSERVAEQSCVESLNFGVSGYGPTQYYLTLDRIIAFRPDLVVMAFTYDNDFEDSVLFERYGYYKPYSMLEKGRLKIKGYPVPDVQKFGNRAGLFQWEWLNRSLLFRKTLELMQKDDRKRPKQRGLYKFSSQLLYRYPPANPHQRLLADKAITINKLLFMAMRDKLAKAGIPLVVVGITTKCEFYTECTVSSSGPADVPLHSKISEIVANTMAELDIPFINTFPHMQPEDYWKKDGHWNPKGHQKAADIISDYLKTRDMMCH